MACCRCLCVGPGAQLPIGTIMRCMVLTDMCMCCPYSAVGFGSRARGPSVRVVAVILASLRAAGQPRAAHLT
eukprot:10479-Prymnesium_polylepis.1